MNGVFPFADSELNADYAVEDKDAEMEDKDAGMETIQEENCGSVDHEMATPRGGSLEETEEGGAHQGDVMDNGSDVDAEMTPVVGSSKGKVSHFLSVTFARLSNESTACRRETIFLV